jgi:hypothetical protein
VLSFRVTHHHPAAQGAKFKPTALRNYSLKRCRVQFCWNECVFRLKCYGCKAVLWGVFVKAFLILMRYRVNFFTGVIPQLQFWHILWLVFIQSVGKLHWQVPRTLQSCATEELLQSSRWRRPRKSSANIHAYCSTNSVCISWSFGHNWDLPCTKCIECTKQRFSSSWQIKLLRMCYPIWQWRVSWDLNNISYFGLVLTWICLTRGYCILHQRTRTRTRIASHSSHTSHSVSHKWRHAFYITRPLLCARITCCREL